MFDLLPDLNKWPYARLTHSMVLVGLTRVRDLAHIRTMPLLPGQNYNHIYKLQVIIYFMFIHHFTLPHAYVLPLLLKNKYCFFHHILQFTLQADPLMLAWTSVFFGPDVPLEERGKWSDQRAAAAMLCFASKEVIMKNSSLVQTTASDTFLFHS